MLYIQSKNWEEKLKLFNYICQKVTKLILGTQEISITKQDIQRIRLSQKVLSAKQVSHNEGYTRTSGDFFNIMNNKIMDYIRELATT